MKNVRLLKAVLVAFYWANKNLKSRYSGEKILKFILRLDCYGIKCSKPLNACAPSQKQNALETIGTTSTRPLTTRPQTTRPQQVIPYYSKVTTGPLILWGDNSPPIAWGDNSSPGQFVPWQLVPIHFIGLGLVDDRWRYVRLGLSEKLAFSDKLYLTYLLLSSARPRSQWGIKRGVWGACPPVRS